ncbi:MAG TPA: hypothetical protein VGZ73_15235 [Bryobacteraceae bacterium]|jgi:hypothetical protein|nr:hypothetical protein [Bryobacteraceae bacterium]
MAVTIDCQGGRINSLPAVTIDALPNNDVVSIRHLSITGFQTQPAPVPAPYGIYIKAAEAELLEDIHISEFDTGVFAVATFQPNSSIQNRLELTLHKVVIE